VSGAGRAAPLMGSAMDDTTVGGSGRSVAPAVPKASLGSEFDIGRILDSVRSRPADEFRIRVRRPDDHLVFDLIFENLTLRTDGGARLERTSPGSNLLSTLYAKDFVESRGLRT
jgi:hypothetical protein